jgi:hypothetical protein
MVPGSGDPPSSRPAGPAVRTHLRLDGRFVTDIEGFYCALGEAINGPGGYFGWYPRGLYECLCGEWDGALRSICAGTTPTWRADTS